MKNIFRTILFLSVISTLNAQEWKLNSVDTSKNYPYEYWFSFQNEDDVSEYKTRLIDNCGKTKLFLSVKDKTGWPILPTIKIIDEAGEEKIFYTDFEGDFDIELKNGLYSLEIRYPLFDEFIQQFTIKNNQCLKFDIKLGKGPELTVYQINSKVSLSEKEILKIINCVKVRRGKEDFSTLKCLKKRKYLVTIHI